MAMLFALKDNMSDDVLSKSPMMYGKSDDSFYVYSLGNQNNRNKTQFKISTQKVSQM